jgi:hypothetical protein
MRGATVPVRLFIRVLVPAFAFVCGSARAADLAPEEDVDEPTVGAALDKSEAHVGDRLSLTVSAVAKNGVVVTLPPKIDLGKLELLARNDGDRNGRDLGDRRRAYRFVLSVAAYETGELTIPEIELSYSNQKGEVRMVRTEAVNVNVRPLVGADEANPELQPERPPRSAWVEDQRALRALRLGGAILGSVILLSVVALFIRRALRRAEAAEAEVLAIPGRPPEEVAIEKLTALRNAGRFDADGYRPFYFALTEIVREYLGARYGFFALDMTTTELLDELQRRAPHLINAQAPQHGAGDSLRSPAAAEAEVPRFFADCDLVKFAKAGSTIEAAKAALDAAQSLVLSTAMEQRKTEEAAVG